MSSGDGDDLQMRIRPIENGFLLSGNARGDKIRQRFFPTIEAIRAAAVDRLDQYLRVIDREFEEGPE